MTFRLPEVFFRGRKSYCSVLLHEAGHESALPLFFLSGKMKEAATPQVSTTNTTSKDVLGEMSHP